MVFSSVLFLYYFLPLVLCVYFLSPAKAKNIVLLAASIFFYAWGAPTLIPLVIILSYVDLCAARAISRDKNSLFARLLFGTAICVNILALMYYKYANFFIDELSVLLGADLEWQRITLPIGISFYTFQKISFLIDVRRGRAAVARNFTDYLLFVLCFPQLIAGPIVRFETVAEQIRKRTHTVGKFTDGLSRFSIGLGKKVLLANPMGEVADTIFALETSGVPSGFAWLGIVAYSMQIYFDFSGYSDMAIGLGRAMGFSFPENFNRPYLATSISDFWHRWHITLSTWMKEYLYIPLGGNRISNKRTYLNLWIVFLLSGLWHGAAWTFIFWGAYHGLFLVLERIKLAMLLKRLPLSLARAYTFIVVLIGWVFFRSDTFLQATQYLRQMFQLSTFFSAHETYLLANVIDTHQIFVLGLCLLISFTPKRSKLFAGSKDSLSDVALLMRNAACAALLLASGAMLVNQSFNPFIYFRF